MLIMLALSVPASAKTFHVRGVVLGLTPKSGEAIIRHDPFDSMPSMAMPFHILPASRLGELQVGSHVEGDVDVSHEPWTMRAITVSQVEALTASPVERHVKRLAVGDLVPDLAMYDQRGRPFVFSQLRGQDVILAFIYTRCQDARMCPLISSKFSAVQRTMGKRSLHLVEVTLDPSYDRPSVLARYGSAYEADPARWTIAVGDAEPTLDFAARFGVGAFPDPAIGLIHSEDTVLIDGTGHIRSMITETAWQPDEVLAQIDAQNGLEANPIARFDLWLSRAAVAVCGNNVGSFSGLADLAIVFVIFAALAYLLVRLARGIFRTN